MNKLRADAEQGRAVSQYILAGRLHEGKGVAKDFEQAVVWYRKAAEQGHAEAQFELAGHLHMGLGVAKDLVQAVEWYR